MKKRNMSASARRVLVVLVAASASSLLPLASSAQPVYSVVDLGPAPEPILPPPYGSPEVDFMSANPDGQVIWSRFIPGNAGSFFWEPGLSAPIRIGRDVDTVYATAISSNGYVVGTSDGGVATPYIWSKATGRRPLAGYDRYLPLGVNSSAIVVGTEQGSAPRAVIWDTTGALAYIDEFPIAGREPWMGFEQARTISDDGTIAGVGRFITSSGTVEPRYFALKPGDVSGGALDRRDWTATATEYAASDPPANAIDGNINTRFSTGRGQHDSQGFRVSWPGDRTVGRIRMDVGASVGDYPRTCGIWVTDTSGRVTFVNCVASGSGSVDVSFDPIPVQKIEVWQWGSSGSWWSIAEFNAYSR